MLQPNANSNSDFMVFTGNANPVLAAEVAYELDVTLGLADVGRFSDGEVRVELKQNVRARDVFVIQSTCAPTNENMMELLIMVDALKRASAGRISAIIPYFGYARQDRRPRSTRVPITAKVVANMLQAVGVNHVLTMDLHRGSRTCFGQTTQLRFGHHRQASSQGQRERSDARHWRHRRPQLRHHGRHD